MATTVEMSELGKELYKALVEYNVEATEATKKAVTDVADKVMSEIKSHITWNDKEYSKSFELKTIYENDRGKYVIWHVKDPHWRLTHLLELGHLKRDGEHRTREFPHVKYGQEYAYNNLAKEIKERIENVRT